MDRRLPLKRLRSPSWLDGIVARESLLKNFAVDSRGVTEEEGPERLFDETRLVRLNDGKSNIEATCNISTYGVQEKRVRSLILPSVSISPNRPRDVGHGALLNKLVYGYHRPMMPGLYSHEVDNTPLTYFVKSRLLFARVSVVTHSEGKVMLTSNKLVFVRSL